jgi:DtxR family Mn-dependent transcriptional regulator
MEGDPVRPTAATEDYTKAIYSLTLANSRSATTSDLATRLRLTPGSVSGMLHKLSEEGLVEHPPYQGVRLTERGERVALAVMRRHRLLETFLAEVLDMPWDKVHDEAEVLEHALSEELVELIARKLGDPAVDPHGDPIPTRDLVLVEPPTRSLADLEPGSSGIFTRVSDSDPRMLVYLADCGITIGDVLTLVARQPFDGPYQVLIRGRELSLGLPLVRRMRISTDQPTVAPEHSDLSSHAVRRTSHEAGAHA